MIILGILATFLGALATLAAFIGVIHGAKEMAA